MKRQTWFVLLMTIILVGGYQNCSNSMSFDAENSSFGKSETPVAGGDAGITDPAAPVQDGDNDDDSDIDYDHDGRKVAFSCSTGAKFGWDETRLSQAQDLNLQNVRSFIFHYSRPIRNVTVNDVRGSLIIKNALRTVRYDGVRGPVSYLRSRDTDRVSDVEAGISSTASIKLATLSKVRAAYICASGSEIGSIEDMQGLYMKFRGRQASSAQAKAKAERISRIRAAFASIHSLDTVLIEDVEGELIIRNSKIDRIDGFKGGLTLINSTVGTLKDAEGVLRLKNSQVDREESSNLRRVNLR